MLRICSPRISARVHHALCLYPLPSIEMYKSVPSRPPLTRVPNPEGHHFRSLRQLVPPMALNIWKLTPERAAVRLVRAILKESPSPLTTKEIYKEAVRREAKRKYPHPPAVVAGASAQQPAKLVNKRGVVHAPPPAPPHPENAVRSVQCVSIHLQTSSVTAGSEADVSTCSGTSKPSCSHICGTTSKKSRNSTPLEPSPTRRCSTA